MLALDWAQKMLCNIVPNRWTASPDFFSWFRTRRLLAPSGFVWLRTKEMHAVRKLSVWYKLPISNTVYPKTIDAFPIACVAWRFCREQSPRGFSALAGIYLLCALNQNHLATQATFPKIQAWTYNGYSRSQPRKRRMKSEFTFFHSLSWLFQLAYFVKCKRTLLKVNFYPPHPNSWREKKFCHCLFTSFTTLSLQQVL